MLPNEKAKLWMVVAGILAVLLMGEVFYGSVSGDMRSSSRGLEEWGR